MSVLCMGRHVLTGFLVMGLLIGQGLARPRSAKAARHATAAAHTQHHGLHKRHRQIARHAPPSATPDSDRPLIVIDPGHGGRDPGAIGVSGTTEKSVTLATALELRRVLAATGRYRIALTHIQDRSVTLASRLAFARQRDADLFIAIHADASSDPHARGASVYVSSAQGTQHFAAGAGDAGRIASALGALEPRPEPGSAWLQYSMIAQLADDVRMVAAPARAAHLYVLASHTIPSVLLEMGFLSNRRDETLLWQPRHRHTIVEAIKDAIDDYFAGIKAAGAHT